MADFPGSVLPLGESGGSAYAGYAGTVFELGGGAAVSYRMMGKDTGAGLTTWTATAPDPDGLQATAGNTTPPLVGAIQAGTGTILQVIS